MTVRRDRMILRILDEWEALLSGQDATMMDEDFSQRDEFHFRHQLAPFVNYHEETLLFWALQGPFENVIRWITAHNGQVFQDCDQPMDDI